MNKLTDVKDINIQQEEKKERKFLERNISPASKQTISWLFLRSFLFFGLIYYRNHYSWLTLVRWCVSFYGVYTCHHHDQNLIKSNKIFVAWILFPWTKTAHILVHEHTLTLSYNKYICTSQQELSYNLSWFI